MAGCDSLDKIMASLTPKVTLVSWVKTTTGIIGEVQYDYLLPIPPGTEPVKVGKSVSFIADSEGNIKGYEGLI